MSAIGSVAKSTDTIHGFAKEGLAKFNAQFHVLVNDGKLANVVTLIARHGEIVNCDAYSVFDISTTPPVPVKTDSIFRIASMTKPITGAAMMMLWEEASERSKTRCPSLSWSSKASRSGRTLASLSRKRHQ